MTKTPYSLMQAYTLLLSPERELSNETFINKHRLMPPPLKEILGKRVLDAGCGSGLDLIRLIFYGSNAVGMDLSNSSLKQLKGALKSFSWVSPLLINGDIENAPFRNGIFDTILCYGVLHHTDHPEKGLAELARMLKVDGTLYLMLYHKHNFWAYTKILLRFVCKHSRTGRNILGWLPPFRDKAIYNDNFINPISAAYTVNDVKQISGQSDLCILKTVICGMPLLRYAMPIKVSSYAVLLFRSYASRYGFLMYFKLRPVKWLRALEACCRHNLNRTVRSS
jgi:ubiquinone/menaquinone biosynthesis C-methylase UbiE